MALGAFSELSNQNPPPEQKAPSQLVLEVIYYCGTMWGCWIRSPTYQITHEEKKKIFYGLGLKKKKNPFTIKILGSIK